MMRVGVGIFIILHGLVHLLYLGNSTRLFELQPGLDWPDGAWAVSGFFGVETTRMLANILLISAALVFVAGGGSLFFKQEWWRVVVISGAAFSSVIYFLLWNGKFERMADNGWVGILINLLILVALLLLKWPKF